jgi:hypothetical protein
MSVIVLHKLSGVYRGFTPSRFVVWEVLDLNVGGSPSVENFEQIARHVRKSMRAAVVPNLSVKSLFFCSLLIPTVFP